MIKAYYRPKTLQEALELLADPAIGAVPLGGGTSISQSKSREVAVVDLQELGLNYLSLRGSLLKIGGTATLHSLTTYPDLDEDFRQAVSQEANYNIRQQATIAGSVVSGDGRSALLTALLALDASLSWLPGGREQGLGEFLLTRGGSWPGRLIESVTLPLNAKLRYSAVGRTPADLPVICAALAVWPSGRLRIALGGFGPYPILALDAPERGGAELAVRDALSTSGDQWASAEYRQEAAAALVRRMLVEL